MSNTKMIMALLGGAAAGIALGLLFAPDKGSKTRKHISSSTKDFVDKILSKAEEMVAEETETYRKRNREKTV